MRIRILIRQNENLIRGFIKAKMKFSITITNLVKEMYNKNTQCHSHAITAGVAEARTEEIRAHARETFFTALNAAISSLKAY